jgi:hypothetical protein
MTRRPLLRQRAWGEAILERLDETYVPPELTRHVRAFKAAHAGLSSATKRATIARERRDAAFAAVGRADGSLERAVLALGKRMAAAGMGPVKDPFAGRSPLRPAQVVALEPARAAAEALRVVARLKHAKPPVPVKKAMAACTEAARGIAAASARVDAAQKDYARALDARDALLSKWTTTLARLRRRAEVVWTESPENVARVFAAPGEDEPETIFDLHPVLPNLMNGVHTS